MQQLTDITGTVDRWAEAVIEGTYGRLSLLPDPVVLPALEMPRTVAPGLNAFSYSGSLVAQHLRRYGYELYRDFHTVLVRAGQLVVEWGVA